MFKKILFLTLLIPLLAGCGPPDKPTVSFMIFGGPDLDELYVTTAGGAQDTDTADGTLYRVKVGMRGLPEFRSNVQVSGSSR